MIDISRKLRSQVNQALSHCAADEFANDLDLRDFFMNNKEISPFANQLPQANRIGRRIKKIIDYLKNKSDIDNNNALVLFLRILSDEIDVRDKCHKVLADLAEKVQKEVQEKEVQEKEVQEKEVVIKLPNFDVVIYKVNEHYFKSWFPPDKSQHPPVPFQLTNEAELREQINSLRSNHLQVTAETVRSLGSKLFESLLGVQTAALYKKASSEPFRLRISAELPELSYIPWELLYDSFQYHYLALHSPVSVVRYIPTGKPRKQYNVAEPLRILYVSAAPLDLPPLDTKRNKANFYQSIDNMLTTKQVEVDELEYATPQALFERLQNGTYHILHYDGHGGFNAHLGQGYLALENEDGDHQPLFDKKLATFVEGKQLLFAFLSACNTTVASTNAPLTGVAQQLVKVGGLPAALAMQFPITDEMASVFTTYLYRTLAEKQLQKLDQAVKEARKAVVAKLLDYEQRLDWAVPVLFLQSEMTPRVRGHVTKDCLLIMLNQSHENKFFLTVKNIGGEALSRIIVQLRPRAGMVIHEKRLRFASLQSSKIETSKGFSIDANFYQQQELSLKITYHVASGDIKSTTATMSLSK